jgi:uncharacterized protein
MITRDLTNKLLDVARQFYVIAILGPRQSGKTTLVQHVFKNHKYVSLEDIDKRTVAQSDPRRFLQEHSSEQGIILDEIQHAPELLSYIQTIVDREKKLGFFVITGSQNLLVSEVITQTLAGRMAYLTLFPLSINELQQASLLPDQIETAVFKGGYPRIYADSVNPVLLYQNYIHGYVERDVRQIKNVHDLNTFQKFIQLCAGRIGQVLNLESLSNDCGVDQKTIRSWISLLEASYIIFLLHPYYKNFGKRLIKSPKLYFVDTGIACSLLNIKNDQELSAHYLRGGLIESFVISDLFKQYYNLNTKPSLFFWRDHSGNEIDCIVEQALSLAPIEIKGGQTINNDYFRQFDYLKKIENFPASQNFVVYAGTENQSRHLADVVSWNHAGTLIKNILGQK